MPRSPYAYNINRGSAPPRKVQRWLRAINFDASKMPVPGKVGVTLLQQAAARHIHPRRLRNVVSSSNVMADRERASVAADPFASLQGKK